MPRLTHESQAFVIAEYDNQKCLSPRDSEQIINFLCNEQWFEPAGKDLKLAQKLAALFDTITPYERDFYKRHLIECVDSELQALLWRDMREVTRADGAFSMTDLLALIKHAQARGQSELARRLLQIQVAESVFAPAAYMFDFMLMRDGQTIEKIANQIRQAWGPKLRSVDSASFVHVLEKLQEETDTTTRTRLTQLANSLAEGHYQNALELLVAQNLAVMKARGGNAWVTLKGETISVGFKENPGPLPTRVDLPLLWLNSYFLNALKTIGYQIEGGL